MEQIKFTNIDVKSNSLELARYKASKYNAIVGNLNGDDCSLCKRKGLIMRVIKLTANGITEYDNDVVECKCMEQRKLDELFHNANMEKYKSVSLDQFKTTEVFQKIMVKKAQDYLKIEDNTWLVILGQSGAGKTMIASSIANEFVKNGKLVRYLVWTDFIAQFKRDISGGDESKANASEYWEAIKQTPILYIDELLKRYVDTDIKYYIELINYRYSNGLKTLITSERMFDELINIDESTASRMAEMTRNKQYLLQIKKERNRNYRLKEEEINLL